MKKIIVLIILIFNFINTSIQAQNTEWLVQSSSIKFKIKNAGFTVDGSFGGLKANIRFDAAKSYSNTIEGTIDSKTINTGSPSRDTHLKKEEYFGVDKFPTIALKATLFAKEKDGSYTGYFKLTIKNITKDVAIRFIFTEKEDKANIKGTFIINRLNYTVGESSMILSDNVTITIDANLIKK